MIKSLIDKILGKTPAKRASAAAGKSAKAPRIPTGKRVMAAAAGLGSSAIALA